MTKEQEVRLMTDWTMQMVRAHKKNCDGNPDTCSVSLHGFVLRLEREGLIRMTEELWDEVI